MAAPPNTEGPRTLKVPDALDGARLDKALVVLAQVSRSGAKALLENGVRVNGRRAVKGAVVHAGDEIAIESTDEASSTSASAVSDPDVALDVRLESEQVVVLHKPPGLATAPLKSGERGTPTAWSRATRRPAASATIRASPGWCTDSTTTRAAW